MYPLKAIRRRCLDCCLGSAREVSLCPATDCVLWPVRMGRKPKMPRPESRFRVLRIIRDKCLDCSGLNAAEVRRCSYSECSLWEYRMGHNPKLKGKGGSFKKTHVGRGKPQEDRLAEAAA